MSTAKRAAVTHINSATQNGCNTREAATQTDPVLVIKQEIG